MWLFRFRNYVRLERGLHLRCRQPLYRYASYVGLDVVPVAVPIARPCAVGDVPDSSRHAPLRDDSHDSRLHGVFCQIFVGRFGVSFSPFERLFLGRCGLGQSGGLSVIA